MPYKHNALGSGSTAFVYEGDTGNALKCNQIWVGDKCLDSKKDDDGDNSDAQNLIIAEAAVYKSLGSHDHILHCYGLVKLRPSVAALSLEVAPHGSIREYMMENKHSPPSQEQRLHLVHGVITGLAFVHSRNITHGDISCRNIFLFPGWKAKLGDFGAATLDGFMLAGEGCEEVRYALPYRGRTFGDLPVVARDLFALGCAIYEILAWRLPFQGASDEEVERKYRIGDFPNINHLPMKEIMQGCWFEKFKTAEAVAQAASQTTSENDQTTWLRLIAAAMASMALLHNTAQQYSHLPQVPTSLRDGLASIVNSLESLSHVNASALIPAHLRDPIRHCGAACRAFDAFIKSCDLPQIRNANWERLAIIRVCIDDLVEMLAPFNSTLAICLDIFTVHNQVPQKILEGYDKNIHDTLRDLEALRDNSKAKLSQLRSEGQMMSALISEHARKRTSDCLHLCKQLKSSADAASYVVGASPRVSSQPQHPPFTVQWQEIAAIDDILISNLEERLEVLYRMKDPVAPRRQLLHASVIISERCLSICNSARTLLDPFLPKEGEAGGNVDDHDQVVTPTV